MVFKLSLVYFSVVNPLLSTAGKSDFLSNQNSTTLIISKMCGKTVNSNQKLVKIYLQNPLTRHLILEALLVVLFSMVLCRHICLQRQNETVIFKAILDETLCSDWCILYWVVHPLENWRCTLTMLFIALFR